MIISLQGVLFFSTFLSLKCGKKHAIHKDDTNSATKALESVVSFSGVPVLCQPGHRLTLQNQLSPQSLHRWHLSASYCLPSARVMLHNTLSPVFPTPYLSLSLRGVFCSVFLCSPVPSPRPSLAGSPCNELRRGWPASRGGLPRLAGTRPAHAPIGQRPHCCIFYSDTSTFWV